MNWLTSLFAGDAQTARRGQTMSSTHDAFSLPTSSPTFGTHAGPDPETATSATFSYPPAGPGPYGYVPTNGGPSSRTASLLPMHRDSFVPPGNYPPPAKSWTRIKAWLAREYPELGDTLNYGILPQDLAQLEMQFGFALPPVVRESYLAVDGQEPESSAGCSEGLFFGLTLLPLEDVFEEWKFWREVDDDPATGANSRLREAMQSIPPQWIRREYSQRGWIPLIADKAGNYVGVDLNPAEAGAQGQVIVFGRDFDTKVVLFNGDGLAGWAKWLATFADDLESGEGFELGPSDGSDGSDDDIGYESYFHDGNGATGDGGGDGTSGGGLRLSGEYRGWNVMEAWADKSVRRWYDSGVVPQQFDQEEGSSKGKARLTSLDVSQGGSAEVPIPVLADLGDDTQPAPALYASHPSRKPTNLPTISITKPPAPLPVELPTPRDIVSLPSPPDSAHSSFEDLEAGRDLPRRSTEPLRQDSSEPLQAYPETLQSYPEPEPEPAPLLPASPPQSLRMSPPPDLLADSAPALDTAPIEPEVSPLRTLSTSPPTEVDPDVTIRLVGGGGMVGAATPEPEEDEAVEETAEVESDASSMVEQAEAGTEGGKKHKKTKSGHGLSGLKKTLVGGLRKKDSKDGSVDSAN